MDRKLGRSYWNLSQHIFFFNIREHNFANGILVLFRRLISPFFPLKKFPKQGTKINLLVNSQK